jgi:hypothetical protein
MKKLLITVALLASFLIFCFGWLLAGGPEDGHTWDERSNSFTPPQDGKTKATTVVVIQLDKWSVLIWRIGPSSTFGQEAKKSGKLSYIIIER